MQKKTLHTCKAMIRTGSAPVAVVSEIMSALSRLQIDEEGMLGSLVPWFERCSSSPGSPFTPL